MVDLLKLTDLISKCEKIKKHKYKKGELISTYIVNRNQISIILEGSAYLIRYDLEGNRNIIERFNSGDVYGEIFHNKETINGLMVEATSTTIVAKIEYSDLDTECKKDCFVHDAINKELTSIILEKIKYENTRIELLTKRSTREKILAYFALVSKGRINKSFHLPFSYTDLADYLNVDRSAMTREIASLVDEGFILKENRDITILY